ncbi:MAG: FKBP-type peptidyl-prolyl cis-trans isomerase [Fibrobacterota bacterium]
MCRTFPFLFLLLLISVAFPQTPTQTQLVKDSLGYAIGMDVGAQIKQMGVDPASFHRGVDDVINGRPTFFSADQTKEIIQAGLKRIQAKQGNTAKQAGIDFLEKNKTNKGVTVTASGLQYSVERPGKGAKPKATDKVKVHYRGTLVDGQEFDSSYKRGEPISFALNGVIPGWTEGLQLMPVGSKYKLFIPYPLGYGEQGAGASIPPYSALIFEVELLDIVK